MGDERELRAEVDEAAQQHIGPPPAERGRGIGGTVRVFLELVKFEHSIFALPYAYIGALYGGLVLARTDPIILDSRGFLPPSFADLVWITLVMVGARSFAFVVNRAVDKEIDARNPRTAGRAIPAGLVKAGELWGFAVLVLAAFLFGVWQLAPVVRWLWPIVLFFFVVYPYTKRFTPLCHYWLGVCLGLAPVGAWVAVTNSLAHPAPWVFGLAVTLWTAGFDIIYALQDIECDKRDGIHSMPVDLGVRAALIQTRVVHALTWLLLVLGGYLAGATWPWYAAVVIAGLLLAYENAIVKADDFSRLNAAFFTMNGFIAVIVFLGALADRLIGAGALLG